MSRASILPSTVVLISANVRLHFMEAHFVAAECRNTRLRTSKDDLRTSQGLVKGTKGLFKD